MRRVRHAWRVLTGRAIAIDCSIVAHIALDASDLPQSARNLIMSLSQDIAALGTMLETAIATAKSDAATAVSAAHDAAAASEAKAAALQTEMDAATAEVAKLTAELSPPTPIADPAPVDPNAPVA